MDREHSPISPRAEGYASRIADMDDPNGIADDPVKDTILGNRHHPQRGRISPLRIPLWQICQRIHGIQNPSKVFFSRCLTSGSQNDFPAHLLKIVNYSRGMKNSKGHNPSFAVNCPLVRHSPRSNSASASATESLISSTSSSVKFPANCSPRLVKRRVLSSRESTFAIFRMSCTLIKEECTVSCSDASSSNVFPFGVIENSEALHPRRKKGTHLRYLLFEDSKNNHRSNAGKKPLQNLPVSKPNCKTPRLR